MRKPIVTIVMILAVLIIVGVSLNAVIASTR